MFTLTGIPRHRRKVAASVTWDNGRLTGDALLVQEAKDNALFLEGRPVGFDGGPMSLTDHLKNPHAAAWILGELFRPGTIQVSGELEPWPAIPEGAVT